MPTCSKIDDEVNEKDGIRQTVENDPPRTEVVVEEGYGYGKDDEVCH